MTTVGTDLRTRLERLRDLLEGRLQDATDRDIAPLAARYQAVLADLAALPDPNAAADGVESAQAQAEATLRLVQ